MATNNIQYAQGIVTLRNPDFLAGIGRREALQEKILCTISQFDSRSKDSKKVSSTVSSTVRHLKESHATIWMAQNLEEAKVYQSSSLVLDFTNTTPSPGNQHRNQDDTS